MPADLDRLIDLLARDGARFLAQFVPGSARLSGTMAPLFDEPLTVVDAIRANAAHSAAVEALASDPDLVRIAPKGALGPLLIAANSEPRVSADGLVGTMIGASVSELRCLALEPTPDNLAEIALRNLERLRRIGRSAPTKVTTFLGFGGLSLDVGRDLELPWGRLTGRIGFYGPAEWIPAARPTSCVLVAEHRLSIAIEAPLPPDTQTPASQISAILVPPSRVPRPIVDHHEWILLTSRLVAISIALGTPPNRLAPVPTFQFTVLPYETPMGASSPLLLAPPAAVRPLTSQECIETERWARVLNERYDRRLEVAMRRLVSALSQRIDPADRLIDAVTAWESLFSAEQEASLRVTAAIAWLLEPESEPKRDALQSEANRIYGLRSSVVHGRARDETEVYEGGWRATEIAIQALARLLEGRPELIPVDSVDRSRRLLLGLK
jgi:hypothetical protein